MLRVKTMTRKRLRRRTLTIHGRVWESKRTEMQWRSRMGHDFHMMALHGVARFGRAMECTLGFGSCIIWGREFDMIPSLFFMITRSIRR